jgi:glycosyltransferase involved in cell wall biosynthesis
MKLSKTKKWIRKLLRFIYFKSLNYSVLRKLIIKTPPRIKNSLREFIFEVSYFVNTAETKKDNLADWVSVHALKMNTKSVSANKIGFSIILPVYKVDVNILSKLLQSLKNQTFQNFELCVSAHDVNPSTLKLLHQWKNLNYFPILIDEKSINSGISEASNTALKMASKEFVVLLDHDDELPAYALNLVAHALETDKELDFLYTDKMTVDVHGNVIGVLLKPEWSPEIMLSANYLTHLNVIRSDLINSIGGWDPRTDGAQDWDLFLRISLHTNKIKHIPSICYAWRQVSTSVSVNGLAAKPYAATAQRISIQKYLDVKFPGAISQNSKLGGIKILWPKLPYTHIYFSDANASTLGDFKKIIDELSISGFVIFELNETNIHQGVELVNLVGPLLNKEVACVGGFNISSSGEILDGPRIRTASGANFPLFSGQLLGNWGVLGSNKWIRNSSGIAPNLFAARVCDLIDGIAPTALITELPAILLNLGRLVSLPEVVYTSPSLAPIFLDSSLDDSYYQIPILSTENGPVLKPYETTPIQQHYSYFEQSLYFTSHLSFESSKAQKKTSSQIREVAWLIPSFDSHNYGGIRTILTFANYLATQSKIKSTFYVCGSAIPAGILRQITKDFLGLEDAEFKTYSNGQNLDLSKHQVGIATLWPTAYDLSAAKGDLNRFYLVQDFEPDFYPAGTLKLLAFNSYRLGLRMICNTRGLSQVLQMHGIESESFEPGVDFHIFNPRGKSSPNRKIVKIFFYMRPGHSRNCFEMNLLIIKSLKEEFSDEIEIVCAGSEFNPKDFGLERLVTYVGMKPYSENGEMYRDIDIGVSLMASGHPSYPPLEMMASGVAVVTNFNPYTEWIFQGEHCLFPNGNPRSILEAIRQLIRDNDFRQNISSRAAEEMQKRFKSWAIVAEDFSKLLGLEGKKIKR